MQLAKNSCILTSHLLHRWSLQREMLIIANDDVQAAMRTEQVGSNLSCIILFLKTVSMGLLLK